MWKCLSTEWITKLFDCRETAETTFTKLVLKRGASSLTWTFLVANIQKGKLVGFPAVPFERPRYKDLGTANFQKLCNSFPINYACFVIKSDIIHFKTLSICQERVLCPGPGAGGDASQHTRCSGPPVHLTDQCFDPASLFLDLTLQLQLQSRTMGGECSAVCKALRGLAIREHVR